MTSPETSLESKELACEMESATAAIRRALEGLAPGSRLELGNFLEAFRGVQRVSEFRHSLQRTHASDTDSTRADAEYRAALADWERHLPRLHGWLLAERTRLGSRSGHANLVRAWVDADQRTR